MTTDDGKTWRLVTETGEERHESPEPLSLDDVAAFLEVEEELHRAAGWETERLGAMLRCERYGRVRWIWPREERRERHERQHHRSAT